MPNLRILPTNVPKEMFGTCFPIELISPAGRLVRQLIRIERDQVARLEVKEPGNYVVRLELPSGDLFSTAASTEDGAEAKLDLGDHEDPFNPVLFSKHLTPVTRSAVKMARQPLTSSESTRSGPRSFSFSLGDEVPEEEDGTIAVDSYAFQGWTPEGALQLRPNSFVHERITLPQKIEERFGFARLYKGGPLYLWVPNDHGGCLTLWPPFTEASSLDLLPDDHAPFTVCSIGPDPDTEALYNYMLAGSYDLAKVALDPILKALSNASEPDPVQCILAAYVQRRVAPDRTPDWLLTLSQRFPYIVDAAILPGCQLIAEGREEEAVPLFLHAYRSGIPIFTEGIHLQLHSTNILCELFPDNPHLAQARQRAHLLAAIAVMNSEVTCLRFASWSRDARAYGDILLQASH